MSDCRSDIKILQWSLSKSDILFTHDLTIFFNIIDKASTWSVLWIINITFHFHFGGRPKTGAGSDTSSAV